MLMLFSSVVQLPKSSDLMQERVKTKQLIGFPPFYIPELHQIAVNFCVFENVCMCDSSSLSRCAACTYTYTVNSYSFNKKNKKTPHIAAPHGVNCTDGGRIAACFNNSSFLRVRRQSTVLLCLYFYSNLRFFFYPLMNNTSPNVTVWKNSCNS